MIGLLCYPNDMLHATNAHIIHGFEAWILPTFSPLRSPKGSPNPRPQQAQQLPETPPINRAQKNDHLGAVFEVYPPVNQHRPWKWPVFTGNSSSKPLFGRIYVNLLEGAQKEMDLWNCHIVVGLEPLIVNRMTCSSWRQHQAKCACPIQYYIHIYNYIYIIT